MEHSGSFNFAKPPEDRAADRGEDHVSNGENGDMLMEETGAASADPTSEPVDFLAFGDVDAPPTEHPATTTGAADVLPIPDGNDGAAVADGADLLDLMGQADTGSGDTFDLLGGEGAAAEPTTDGNLLFTDQDMATEGTEHALSVDIFGPSTSNPSDLIDTSGNLVPSNDLGTPAPDSLDILTQGDGQANGISGSSGMSAPVGGTSLSKPLASLNTDDKNIESESLGTSDSMAATGTQPAEQASGNGTEATAAASSFQNADSQKVENQYLKPINNADGSESSPPPAKINDDKGPPMEMTSAADQSLPVGGGSTTTLKEDSSIKSDATATPDTTKAKTETNAAELFAAKDKIALLEKQLAESQAQIESAKSKHESYEKETAELMMELQSNLQKQMSLKAEAENKLRLSETTIQDLQEVNDKQAKQLADFSEMQNVMQEQMTAKAEAENKVRLTGDKVGGLEKQINEQSSKIETLEKEVVELRQARAAQEEELVKIREQRDEQERKEHSLTSRLNEAKKKEAVQANLAEGYEDEIKALQQDLDTARASLEETSSLKNRLEKELEDLKQSSESRIRRAEAALADERTLNEERKKKMKAFVENRAEELRQAKADNDALQDELNQTNRSFSDLNNRWKQLHAQWVQSQTRNRELQRDLNRIKKDSENLHKVGDTLEMKLSRSATATEEHKNKRLAAKHELMTVLRTLEAERELNTKLRDSLKFTFTPKALSQQQLLHEGLEEFETQLQRLSQRLRRPLPPQSAEAEQLSDHQSSSHDDGDFSADLDLTGDDAARITRSNAEIQRLISKLEYETQRVSQCIMALSSSIERMHVVLDGGGERTCFTVLSELVTTGTISSVGAAAVGSRAGGATSEETASMTGSPSRLGALRSHQYGHVPTTLAD